MGGPAGALPASCAVAALQPQPPSLLPPADAAAYALLPPYLRNLSLSAPPAAQSLLPPAAPPLPPAAAQSAAAPLHVPPPPPLAAAMQPSAAPAPAPPALQPAVTLQPAVAPAPAPPPPPPLEKECCICFTPTLVTELRLLLPCGHRCLCEQCAGVLMAKPAATRKCPLCDEAVTGVMRVFDL
jgi:hypothetical protein